MRKSLFVSAVLHVAIIASALIVWPHAVDLPEDAPLVPVDLVTIGNETNIAPQTREAPKPEPQEEPLKLEVPPPLADTAPPEPELAAVPEPEVSAPKFDFAPEPTPEKPPKPVTPPKSETPKPETPKSETKQQKFDPNQILALLDKNQPQTPAASTGRPSDRDVKGIGAQDASTASLADALRSQIAECWTPPAGAPNVEKLIVDVRISLNRDGSIARPPQLASQSASAAASNPFVRAAAESALRAINVCAPYKLPADRYSDWNDFTMTFDPRKMAGQ
jgi:outer membrane biosynthesis protein TonB